MRRCMGAGQGSGPSGPRAPATVLHAETSSGNGRELCIPCVLRLACGGGSGEQEPFPHVTCRFGVVLGVPLLANSINFTPFLQRNLALDRSLPRVVAIGQGVV